MAEGRFFLRRRRKHQKPTKARRIRVKGIATPIPILAPDERPGFVVLSGGEPPFVGAKILLDSVFAGSTMLLDPVFAGTPTLVAPVFAGATGLLDSVEFVNIS